MLQCCSSEEKLGKTLKNFSFKSLITQKQNQHGPHSKSSSIFFKKKITIGENELSRAKL